MIFLGSDDLRVGVNGGDGCGLGRKSTYSRTDGGEGGETEAGEREEGDEVGPDLIR